MESQRLRLRRFKKDDLDNLILIEGDSDIMRFTPSRVALPVAKIKERLDKLIESEKAYAPYGVWAVEDRVTGEFVAWFMLLQTDLGYPELGFAVVKKFWRQGYALEASRVLIDYGKDVGALGVSARTDGDNLSSINVLSKLGFAFETAYKKEDQILGKEIETRVYTLLF